MSFTEKAVSEAHWRAVGTVVLTAVLTSLVFGVGIAIGYNTAIGAAQEQERER